MIRKFLRPDLVLLVTSLLSFTTMAQQDVDNQMGQTRKNGFYANLFHFEFNPGKTDDALEILSEILIPAYGNAGVEVTLIEDLVGTKDVLLLIPLKDGPSYYNYIVPKQDAEAWEQLSRIAGSSEKAENEIDKFISFVRKQSQTLVFIHKKN